MTTKASALGSNPFAAARARPGGTEIISTEEQVASAPTKGKKASAKGKKAPQGAQKLSNERLNIYLSPDVADYARDAVWALGHRYTMGSMIEEFLPAAIADLEKRFNDGEKFPPRPLEAEKLRPGRPPSVRPRRRREA